MEDTVEDTADMADTDIPGVDTTEEDGAEAGEVGVEEAGGVIGVDVTPTYSLPVISHHH